MQEARCLSHTGSVASPGPFAVLSLRFLHHPMGRRPCILLVVCTQGDMDWVHQVQNSVKSEGGEEKRGKEDTKKETVKQAKQENEKRKGWIFFSLQNLACSCRSWRVWAALKPEKSLLLDLTSSLNPVFCTRCDSVEAGGVWGQEWVGSAQNTIPTGKAKCRSVPDYAPGK